MHPRDRSSLCAQQTRFDERTCEKIVGQRQLADLGLHPRHIDLGLLLNPVLPKNRGCALLQPRLPVRDLVGVNIELLGQLSQRLVPLQGG